MRLLLLTESVRQSTFWNDRHLLSFYQTLFPPNSTDLKRLKHKIWGELQQRVYQAYDVDALKKCLIDVWHSFEQIVIRLSRVDTVDEWRKRLSVDIRVKEGDWST